MACIQSITSVSSISSGIRGINTFTTSISIKSKAFVIRASEGSPRPDESGSKTPEVSVPPTASVTPEPTKLPKVSTKFGDIFSFSGPAPETINGRLAMLGFTAALVVEKSTGAPLSSQLGGSGFEWFVFSAALFSAASLIPMFKGVTVESKSGGFFNSNAEKLNGRVAMLGLVALAITEYVKGAPLV